VVLVFVIVVLALVILVLVVLVLVVQSSLQQSLTILPTVLICVTRPFGQLVTDCQFTIPGQPPVQLTPRPVPMDGYVCNEINYDGRANTTASSAGIGCAIAKDTPPYQYLVSYYDVSYAGTFRSLSDIPYGPNIPNAPQPLTVRPGLSHSVQLQGPYRWFLPVTEGKEQGEDNFAFGGYYFVKDVTSTNNFVVTGVVGYVIGGSGDQESSGLTSIKCQDCK